MSVGVYTAASSQTVTEHSLCDRLRPIWWQESTYNSGLTVCGTKKRQHRQGQERPEGGEDFKQGRAQLAGIFTTQETRVNFNRTELVNVGTVERQKDAFGEFCFNRVWMRCILRLVNKAIKLETGAAVASWLACQLQWISTPHSM